MEPSLRPRVALRRYNWHTLFFASYLHRSVMLVRIAAKSHRARAGPPFGSAHAHALLCALSVAMAFERAATKRAGVGAHHAPGTATRQFVCA